MLDLLKETVKNDKKAKREQEIQTQIAAVVAAGFAYTALLGAYLAYAWYGADFTKIALWLIWSSAIGIPTGIVVGLLTLFAPKWFKSVFSILVGLFVSCIIGSHFLHIGFWDAAKIVGWEMVFMCGYLLFAIIGVYVRTWERE